MFFSRAFYPTETYIDDISYETTTASPNPQLCEGRKDRLIYTWLTEDVRSVDDFKYADTYVKIISLSFPSHFWIIASWKYLAGCLLVVVVVVLVVGCSEIGWWLWFVDQM